MSNPCQCPARGEGEYPFECPIRSVTMYREIHHICQGKIGPKAELPVLSGMDENTRRYYFETWDRMRAINNAPALSIVMPCYDDFYGVNATIQSLRIYHGEALDRCEIVVADNHPESEHGRTTEEWVSNFTNARYFKTPETVGSAPAKNAAIAKATGRWILCMDSHVFLWPGAIQYVLDWIDSNPEDIDLHHGPLVFDQGFSLSTAATHMRPVWSGEMWGVWSTDPRAMQGVPFEIPFHGMGMFFTRRDVWPGFHHQMRGFGAEEGTIHEVYRRRGGKAVCHPAMMWSHRFTKVSGTAGYPCYLKDKFRNYLINFRYLNIDPGECIAHFAEKLDFATARDIVAEVMG